MRHFIPTNPEYLNNKNFSEIEKDFLNTINSQKRLTKNEEDKLFEKINNGDTEAFQAIINANLWLLPKAANCFLKETNLTFFDLIQEGYFGLINAIKNYDSSRNIRFYKYAYIVIIRLIKRNINKSYREYGIPWNLLQLNRDYKKLLEVSEIDMTDEEIATKLNVSVTDILKIKKYQYDITSYETLAKNQFYWNETNLINESEIIEELYDTKNIAEEFLKYIDSQRTKEIIEYQYGLNGKEQKTTLELAKIYNISSSRISYIERDVLYKLRNTPLYEKLIYDYGIEYLCKYGHSSFILNKAKRQKEKERERKKLRINSNIKKKKE